MKVSEIAELADIPKMCVHEIICDLNFHEATCAENALQEPQNQSNKYDTLTSHQLHDENSLNS